MQRLKSGSGEAVSAFIRMLITTSGLYSSGLNWYLCRGLDSEKGRWKRNVQFENGKICHAIVFLTTNLVVEVVLENADIRRIVSVDAGDEVLNKLCPCGGCDPSHFYFLSQSDTRRVLPGCLQCTKLSSSLVAIQRRYPL